LSTIIIRRDKKRRGGKIMIETKTPKEMGETVLVSESGRKKFAKILQSAEKDDATHVVLWRLQDEGWTIGNNTFVHENEDPMKEAAKHFGQVIVVPLQDAAKAETSDLEKEIEVLEIEISDLKTANKALLEKYQECQKKKRKWFF
jgi:chromosome segregation ATPase